MVFGLILKLVPTYGNLTRILAFVVGLVFPTLESMKAVESKQLNDDTQWLMYWVSYSTLLSLETVAWSFLIWIPFYRLLRVLAMAWLALPQTRGATLLYHQFVRPFLLVAVNKARELPALEPYASQFLESKRAATAAESPASAAAGAQAEPGAPGTVAPSARPAPGMLDFDAKRREAGAAGQQAASEDEPMAYQPLKSHAQ